MAELMSINVTIGRSDYTGKFNYAAGGKLEDQAATFKYGDGSKYEGGFLNNRKHGQGTMTYVSGATYVGTWIDGKQDGTGVHTYESGNVYTGNFKDGKRSGQGVYKQPNGDLYEGEWDNDMRHGEGKKTVGGRSLIGQFSSNKFLGHK